MAKCIPLSLAPVPLAGMFLSKIRSRSAQNDLRYALPDRLVVRIHRLPTAFAFEPALVIDDVFHVGNF